jgi:hypothetical protein
MGWKVLGRFWGVPSLFRNFLEIFLCKEIGLVTSCVHSPGNPSIFFSLQSLTRGVWAGGISLLRCAVLLCTGFLLCRGLASSSFGLGRPGLRENGKGVVRLPTRGPSPARPVLIGVSAVVGGYTWQRERVNGVGTASRWLHQHGGGSRERRGARRGSRRRWQ